MHPPDAAQSGAALLGAMLEDMLDRRYLVTDGQGRISRWSQGAERLFGWREEEVAGRSAFTQPLAWSGDGLELWKAWFESSKSVRPPVGAPFTMLCRPGWGVGVTMTAVPVPLVLGYEFTMLVADLAVGGPGSQSEEGLIQVHTLAADAIAAALREDAAPIESVAGLLVTFRATGEAVDLGDQQAQHAARALAIEREDESVAGPAAAEVDIADDGAPPEELAAVRTRLEEATVEIERLRAQLGEERQRSGDGVAEAQQRRDALAAELAEAVAERDSLRAEIEAAVGEQDSLRAEVEAAVGERDSLRAEVEAAVAERDSLQAGQAEAVARAEALQGELDARARACDELSAALDAKTGEIEALPDREALEGALRERDEARAELADALRDHDATRAALEEAVTEQERFRAELDGAVSAHDKASASAEALAAEQDSLRAELEAAVSERDKLTGEAGSLREELDAAVSRRDELVAELDSLRAELSAAASENERLVAERDEVRARLADALASLDAATRERESVGAVAGESERRQEQLKAELEASVRRCDELTVALEAKTAELEALPKATAMEAAKRDRDEARSALAAALAERDRAESALDAAATARDEADSALRDAEAERDEMRRRLEEAASESEAAHTALAEQEARAEDLRARLAEAEEAAVERAAEADTARRQAIGQRERVEAGFLATEALAAERARVSELEAHIAELRAELGRAVEAAEERRANASSLAERVEQKPALNRMRPGLDDVDTPRARIGLDGRFTEVNHSFCNLVGWSEAEFRRAHWPPVVDATHRDDLRRVTALILAGDVESAEVETVYMTGKGTLAPVVGTLRLERDDAGAASHLVLDAQPLSAVSA